MRLTHLKVTNFQAVASFDKDLGPFTLIAGANEAGKSSIADAIEFAFTGNPGRAENKKNLSMLVHEGTKEGNVTLSAEAADGGLELSRTVSSGKLNGAEPALPLALQFVLQGSRFARDLDPVKRRSFLFSLMGIKLGPDEIRQRLVKRGIDAGLVEQIMHLLAGGFAPAHTEAERRRLHGKGQWHEVTGETWGIKKAEGWIAPAPAFDQAELETLEQDLAAWQSTVDRLNVKKGELDAAKKRYDQLPSLREQARQHATIADRLKTATGVLEQETAKLSEMSLPAEDKRDHEPPMRTATAVPAPSEMTCPECMAKLMLKGGVLLHYKLPEAAPPPAAAPAAPKATGKAEKARQREEYAAQRNRIKSCQDQVDTDKRLLAEADGAGKLADQIEATPFDEPAHTRVSAEIADAKQQVQLANSDRDKMIDVQRQHAEATRKTARASSLHADIRRWDDLVAALSPDGIPADVLGEALGPLSKLLKESAKRTGWRLVEVNPAMDVTYGGRPYQLQSESAKWRIDAMLAVAFARLSRVGIVMLDRYDCLDLAGRDAAMNWLLDSIDFDELESVVLLGTLKSAPKIDGATVHWIGENAP